MGLGAKLKRGVARDLEVVVDDGLAASEVEAEACVGDTDRERDKRGGEPHREQLCGPLVRPEKDVEIDVQGEMLVVEGFVVGKGGNGDVESECCEEQRPVLSAANAAIFRGDVIWVS